MDKINRILNINGVEIQYEIARSKRAKRMRIEVRSNKLRASIPMRQNIKDIEKFIALNKNWIARRIQTSTTELITHEAFVFADYAKVKKHAFDLISDRLEIFNLHYKLKWQKIRIKNQETLWGSCSKKRNLNFNYRLYFLPVEIRDYVIVHELCHLKEFNHSDRFWRLVGEKIPNYKSLRNELKKYELRK